MATKFIEMTGKTTGAGFSTKEVFLSMLKTQEDYDHAKMSKKNNIVNILVTNDLDSETSKMKLAKSLGIEIMTYEQLAEMYDIQGDL